MFSQLMTCMKITNTCRHTSMLWLLCKIFHEDSKKPGNVVPKSIVATWIIEQFRPFIFASDAQNMRLDLRSVI